MRRLKLVVAMWLIMPVDAPNAEAVPISDGAREVRSSIVVDLPERRLNFYDREGQIHSYPVAIGAKSTPTPAMKTFVGAKTDSGKIAEKRSVDCPAHDVGGKVGRDAPALLPTTLHLNIANHAIRPIQAPARIGEAETAGSIELVPNDMAELYELVPVCTPVEIVGGAADGLDEIAAGGKDDLLAGNFDATKLLDGLLREQRGMFGGLAGSDRIRAIAAYGFGTSGNTAMGGGGGGGNGDSNGGANLDHSDGSSYGPGGSTDPVVNNILPPLTQLAFPPKSSHPKGSQNPVPPSYGNAVLPGERAVEISEPAALVSVLGGLCLIFSMRRRGP